MNSLRVIILAAGKGTRMKSDIPKVLHEVGGQPILKYVLDAVRKLGSLIYVIIGHQGEEVKKILDGRKIIAVKQKRLLGTADAIRRAQRGFKNYRGDVLIVCADTPLLREATLRSFVKAHQQTKAVCTVLTTIVDSPQGYGRIIRDTNDRVTAIREEKDASDQERRVKEINAGVYCVRSQELFETLERVKLNKIKKEFYLTDIIENFVKKNLKVEAVQTRDSLEGLGINTREDLSMAARVLRQRILKKLMEEGVTIVDPAATFIDVDVKIGKDTVIRPFSYIERGVQIGRRCKIGPFARLRPGTIIADDVEIGNFTEVSRTKMGARSLMKHFSFLGDTAVGKEVNIGAGTVTANFDGKNKNKTIIADHAFIGSDSVLIAPVKVGKRAVVGAGSVVTKGKVIPAGAVALGVPARIIRTRRAQ